MSGSGYGTLFRITSWGETHGKGVGVVVDGCPAGLALTEADIQVYLDRRRPGQSAFTTKRKESDTVEILSGVFEGKTTGTPISLIVYNKDHKSRDYSALRDVYRPGHADYTYAMKYGIRDHRGGGRASGRETIARVAGGAIAAKVLKELGISLFAFTESIGPWHVIPENVRREARDLNPLYMPDPETAAKAQAYLEDLIEKKDSSGGAVVCLIEGMPAGIGEPVFDKLSAELGKAILSIGAVKGFEIGDGTGVSGSTGSRNNDYFGIKDGRITTLTNHAGGMLGGISTGAPVSLRASFKPTPSVGIPQRTVTTVAEETEILIGGRHDPVIVPRAVVVVECMCAVVVLDLLLRNMGKRMDRLKRFYKEK